MDRFEYVMVMVSIVIGLALTHLLQGLVDAAQKDERGRFWTVHRVWVMYMLMTVTFFWWWEFKLQALTDWSFGAYVFVLSYAGLIYFQSTLLFPKEISGGRSLDEFFMEKRGLFFGINAAVFLMDVVDTALKGASHLKAVGWEYWVATAFNVVFSLVAIKVRSRAFHWAFALAAIAYQLSWALREFGTLSMGQ